MRQKGRPALIPACLYLGRNEKLLNILRVNFLKFLKVSLHYLVLFLSHLLPPFVLYKKYIYYFLQLISNYSYGQMPCVCCDSEYFFLN